ncbi:MAG TPA: bifunctional 3,4-dihydroxy-2-butanone-4-phosphate synthase/GTP cyclohydrolase II [Gemmatimonadetes bacterium]|nr:bifunctional 3,4-dihydroxy-2-butanone-4-phosphate synthase/GTP cyclohydrolase II [Gemmatimonadota bacterium]HAT37839.1 bifunctional 3,4-dihydroxy-2-butanone-4-phosphate synthase/GTP cyclohydrolase II [Gemmatimonadota bacterium]|tara:strand:- start:230 stop:1429 length:1200 start_codon:yes stop_codon:yes gene_type:complete
MKFDSVEDAIEDIRRGRMVIVADDEDRENEGDLVMAASMITPQAVNFMAEHGRGLICVTMLPDLADRLDLPLMTDRNTDPHQTAFTISVDAHTKYGVTTGISAQDRAKTIELLASEETVPEDFRRPGHVFPLRAKSGGVLRRVGQTEASVDLSLLAGLPPVGVICEILDADGTMARRPKLEEFAAEHELKFITVAQLVRYRLTRTRLVERIAVASMPSAYGDFDIIGYSTEMDGREHIALVKGNLDEVDNVLVRMHSECLTGDVFGSKRCDCGEQLQAAMRQIDKEGAGAIVYLRQEGRGIGLGNKLKAYHLQDGGLDTVEANEELGFKPDLRDYGIGAQILLDLGIQSMRLLTNNPRKVVGLDGYDLEITGREPLLVEPGEYNSDYLATKKTKLGHIL